MAPTYRPHHRAAATHPSVAAARDPANELYDRASDLLDATQRLRRAAATPGSWPAVAATVGCLEAALDELAATAANMGLLASTRTGSPTATAIRDVFERLRLQLALAQSTCGSARASTASLLAQGPDQAA